MNTHYYTRRLLTITGADARSFLQGMITQDVNLLREDALLFTAILSPQGKLLYDGFLLARGESLLLDIAESHADACLTYLKRYKLRADIQFTESTDQLSLLAEGGLADPRHAELPTRHYAPQLHADAIVADLYHAKRLSLAIPEAANDAMNDTPMDLGYDLLNAISFTKGCYIGQEVTARMKYKQIARKLPMRVDAAAALPELGTEITSGNASLGTLRSSWHTTGLALVKLDTLHDALSSHTTITINSQLISLHLLEWGKPRHEQWSQGKAAPTS